MKKTLTLMFFTSFLINCGSNGNTKPDQVSKNSDSDLICTTKRTIGTNMPTKVCRTAGQVKKDRAKTQEALRNSK